MQKLSLPRSAMESPLVCQERDTIWKSPADTEQFVSEQLAVWALTAKRELH